MDELLLDRSKWQGEITNAQVAKQKAAGVRGITQKFSQGVGYQDPTRTGIARYSDAGLPVGSYHFCENTNATDQFNNYVKAMEGYAHLLSWISLDCEAYSSVNGKTYSIREIRTMLYDVNALAASAYGFRMFYKNGVNFHKFLRTADSLGRLEAVVRAVYGLAYPSEAVVDSIGRKLITWMQGQPSLSAFAAPWIYTNAGSGNKIFKSPVIGTRYPLWVANWRTSVPYYPAVWRGQKHVMWQYDVVSGAPYGIDGNVDVNKWGEFAPFPGTVEPPNPPPAANEVRIKVTYPSGEVYSGTLDKSE